MTTLIESATSTKHVSVWWQTARVASLAVVLGSLSGLACAGVRFGFRLLQAIIVGHSGLLPYAAAQLSPVHRAMIPVLGAALATLVLLGARRWSRDDCFEEYVIAIRLKHGRIPLTATLWRTISSAFSVATGAAVGREGSMIQFATAITSWVGARLGLKEVSLARQVAFGAAAAVSSAYQAPFAAVLFVLEIVLEEWTWTDLAGLTMASLSGWMVSRVLLGNGPLFSMPGYVNWSGFLWAIPLTLVLAALGPMYQKLLQGASCLRKLPAPLLWSGLIVGLLSGVEPAVWGNGDVALATILDGKPVLLSAVSLLALRLVTTTTCVGAGTIGGVFTPTLFTGAALGFIGSELTHAPQPYLMTLIGLSVFLAAVTHAPWMAAFMAVELTGQWHLLPLIVLLNLGAVMMARRISPQSLYGIATPAPTQTGSNSFAGAY